MYAPVSNLPCSYQQVLHPQKNSLRRISKVQIDERLRTQHGLFAITKKNEPPTYLDLSGLGFGSSRLGLLTLVLRSRSGLLLGLVLLGASLALVAVRRRPQGQVVTQELHDQGAVTVALFGEGVELSNGVIERLLGKVASTVGRVQNLVVENGEVEGESKTDRVGWGEFGLSDIGSVLIDLVSIAFGGPLPQGTYLVSLVGGGSSCLTLAARSELSKVTVVVTLPVHQVNLGSNHVVLWTTQSCLHLVVEDLGLASLGLGNEGLVQNVEDIPADALEFLLDLQAVVTDDANVLLRTLGLLLLFDGGDDTPRGTAGADNVLVRNGQKVTLIDGKFASNLMREVSQGMGRDPVK